MQGGRPEAKVRARRPLWLAQLDRRDALRRRTFSPQLYRFKGIKSTFDAVGLHPYASDVRRMRTQIVGIRRVMEKARDGRHPDLGG